MGPANVPGSETLGQKARAPGELWGRVREAGALGERRRSVQGTRRTGAASLKALV